MKPADTLLDVAPWLCWAAGSVLLAMEPIVGSALYTLAAIWLSLSLARRAASKMQRLLRLLLVPLPAIVILLRRLPMLDDVGAILHPFYIAPAAIAVFAALSGAFFVGVKRESK